MPKNQEETKRIAAGSDTESGEGEDDTSSSSEDGSTESDSEPEDARIAKNASLPPAASKNSQPQFSAKPPQNQQSSSDDEESETESDEPALNAKPIAAKPGGDRNPRSKSTSSESVKPTGGKRLAEEKESEPNDAKRSKKQPDSELENSEKKSNDDAKKQLFQRLWSEDDEIAILKGIIDYLDKKKSDPVADMNAFHEFIRGDLHVEVTRAQLQDKIRRLRKKYLNNKSKEKKDGKDRVFSKPHEHKTYELSKQIWGDENGKETGVEKLIGSPKGNGKSAKKMQNKKANNELENGEYADAMDVEVSNGSLDRALVVSNVTNVEESVLRSGDALFGGDGKVDGEKEWRKLRIQEMEIYLEKLDLMRAQTKMVLDVLKSSE